MKKILTVILVLAMVFGVGAFATAEKGSYETPLQI